jgi:hypothetical protein
MDDLVGRRRRTRGGCRNTTPLLTTNQREDQVHDTEEEDGMPADEPAETSLFRTPPLLLAGIDEDELELHLVRGID